MELNSADFIQMDNGIKSMKKNLGIDCITILHLMHFYA